MKSEQAGTRSSAWTTAGSDPAFLLGLFLLTAFHFVLAAYFPPAEDELYYWTWAKQLQGGYFDHPPMVAYWIAFSTKIFGDTLFGIRFFSVISGTLTLLMLRRLTTRSQVLLLVLFTPLFFLGSVFMTPDAPLLLFWTLYLLWIVSMHQSFSEWADDPVSRVYHSTPVDMARWVLGGVILGLGILSKYSMFLVLPCAFLAFFTQCRLRAWITGYAIHILVGLAVAYPVIRYNWTHDFVSFRFQWSNAMVARGDFMKWVWDFIGGQYLLLGGLPFLMLPWVLIKKKEFDSVRALQACYFFFIPCVFFFLLQSTRTKLEANWGLVSYIAFWPMAQRLLDRSSFKGAGRVVLFIAFGPAIAASFFLLAHWIRPFNIVPAEKDRVAVMADQYKLFGTIAHDLEGKKVFTQNYQWTSYLRYYGLPANQIHPSGKMSHFTMTPERACDSPEIYYFSDSLDPLHAKPALECFQTMELAKEYPLEVRGKVVKTFYLTRYTQ